MNCLRTAGFTLVELLTSLAILGIMLAALTSVEFSTMKASSELTVQADQVRSLQDLSGYLGDRLRASRDVSTSTTVNGAPCTLTPASGDTPCFALLVAEARQVGTTVQYDPNTYLYLAYRLVPRSQLTTADKGADSWADSNTFAVVESRSVVCQPDPAITTIPPCTTPPSSLPANFNTSTPNVLMDYGTLDATSGSFAPFAYSATGQFTLLLRQKRLVRGSVKYSPSSAPLQLVVQRRN